MASDIASGVHSTWGPGGLGPVMPRAVGEPAYARPGPRGGARAGPPPAGDPPRPDRDAPAARRARGKESAMEEEAGVAKGKERRVTFRMEGGDYDALCERCERAGLSKSEYLRYLVRIPLSTEANAGDEHRILVDRRALWAMSRELTKWGYHYNQAVHAMNLINFHARHGRVDRDLVAESVPTIERELADVNAAAREMAAELGRIGADSLVEGSPCRS